MRPIKFCLVVLAALAPGCGTDAASGDPGDDDPGDPGGDPGDGAMLPPPARGFQIVSPDIAIPAGKEITYCYYFKTPNTATLPIQSWKSHLTPGSHHMILYFTRTEEQPAGTVSADNCGGGGGGLNAPVWTYASQVENQEFKMPGDDGTGLPLAQNVAAGQPAYIQMHYLNASDREITVHVELNANAYPEGTAVRGAAAYITYNTQISLGAQQGSRATAMGICNVSPTLKFFTMSTHVHKQGIHTHVKDADTMVFESSDWEHPGEETWDASPFFSFASGKLSYQCDYLNGTGSTAPIVDGPSAATNEMCMAIGYYFDPARTTVTSRYCIDSFSL